MSNQIAPADEHRHEIEALREAIQKKGKYNPDRHEDRLLLRFLRARRFDLQKAEKMLLDCEQWRIDFDVEGIVQNFVFHEAEEVEKLYPRFYHKTDKVGCPIYIERLEKLEIKSMFEITDQDRIIKKHVREYEKLMRYRLPSCSEKAGRPIEQCCTILDLKGVPLSSFNQVRKLVQMLSSIAQDYYPETLGRMFIINAPTVFTAIWVIIKGMLDENTVAKISVIGSNYQKHLLETIDPENLPQILGGSCNCPGGCTTSDIGPWNDGSVPNYPIAFFEDFKKRDAPKA